MNKIDFTFRDEGSLVLLDARSAAARAWVRGHLPDDRTTWGPHGTAIEPRYFLPIAHAIIDEGYTLKQL